MPILADTHAVIHGGQGPYLDDPATNLAGWPGTSAVLQSRKMNFTLTNLGTTTKIYTGGSYADMHNLADFYINLGATVDMEEGPVYKLTVNLPYDEFFNLDADPLKYALWEVTPHAVERDIFDVGIFAPPNAGGVISNTRKTVNNTIKGAIQFAYKNPNLTVDLTVKPEWAAVPGTQYLAENFLALKRLGSDSVQGFTQTVKRTLVVNVKNSLAYDPITEGGIPYGRTLNVLLSAGELVNLYNVPPAISVHFMPSYSRTKTITGQDGVTLVGLAGYLAKRPTYQQVTPNKIQLSQEFVWDEWMDSLYYPYNGDYSVFPPLT